jgi:hypothetical protein
MIAGWQIGGWQGAEDRLLSSVNAPTIFLTAGRSEYAGGIMAKKPATTESVYRLVEVIGTSKES